MLFLSVFGCDRNSRLSECIISSSIYDDPVAENIISTLDHYRFIILDSSRPESLLGGVIGKIQKYGHDYFVSCDYKRLVRFDEAGGFLYEINRIGRGPGEYSMLSDYDVKGDVIAILDANKINLYDCVDGSFVRSISLNFVASNIKIIDDSHFLIYASDHNIYKINDSGLSQKKQDRAGHLSRLSRQKPFVEYENKLLVQTGHSNDLIIYDIDKDAFSDAILWADDQIMTASEEDNYINLHGNNYGNEVKAAMIDGLASSADQLMFGRISGGNDITGYVVDSKSGSIIHSLSERTFDDLTFTSPFFYGLSSICYAEDCFLTYLHPFEILEGIAKNSAYADQEHYQWLVENIVPKLSEDGNPVIVEFNFKSK